MKFMKLGSRPDTFYTTEAIRSISTEVSSDLIIQVKGSRYLLHKFPLLSKCQKLQRLCSESPPESQQAIQLPEFPGGAEAFELCAKFCYGITITLSAYNAVGARCAAEYLGMSEEVERGNLVHKIDSFLNSCILAGWRDSIVALQTTKALPLWSEELGITARCVEALASKVLANPSRVPLSHSRSSRRGGGCGSASSVGVALSGTGGGGASSSTGWWAEVLAELEIDLYWRTMIRVKSGGKVPPGLFGDALKIYAARWLPSAPRTGRHTDDSDSDIAGEGSSKRRMLLESIVSLLPSERGAVSCSFLLKLLKAANILRASGPSRSELVKRVAVQLEEATVVDLLIPSAGYGPDKARLKYDVDVVIDILEQFMVQGQPSPPSSPPPRSRFVSERHRRSRSAENVDFEFQESRRSSSASHGSKLRVAKLVDGYLQEIAREPNLCLNKFIAVAEAVPEFARVDHDDLYRAIDIYLKAHSELNKIERKKVCKILDCKKLSMEACMHAAQNEMLPLRVVVQVLFFEQARATMCSNGNVNVNPNGNIGNGKLRHHELPSNIRAILASHGIDPNNPSTTTGDDQWSSVSGLIKSPPTSNSNNNNKTHLHKNNVSTLRMKLAEEDGLVDHHGMARSSSSSSRLKAFCALPSRPKRMLTKLWSSAYRTPSEKS